MGKDLPLDSSANIVAMIFFTCDLFMYLPFLEYINIYYLTLKEKWTQK